MIARFKLKPPPSPLERHDQAAWFQWAWAQRVEGERIYDYAFAVPNGSYLQGDAARRAIQGEALKRQGVRKGVPDICIAWPRDGAHGLYIEFKRRGGVPSDVSHEQLVWLDRLRYRGYRAHVAFGLEHAIGITREYFNLGAT